MMSSFSNSRGLIGLLCLVAIALASMASAAPQVRADDEIRWKFKSGEELHYRMVQDTQIRANAGARGSKTTIAQTIDMTWKVLEVDADGVASMSQTIDRMRVKATTPEGTMEADSDSEKLPEALAANFGPIFRTLVGAKFTMKMTPTGKIENVEVPAAASEATAQAPGVGNMLSPESLKEMTQQAAIPLPTGPIEVGKSWTDEKSLTDTKLLITYTYDGTVDQDGRQLAKINNKADLNLDLPKVEGLTAEMEKGELNGEILFDAAAGKLIQSTTKQDLVVSFSGMGQSMRQEVQSLVDFHLVEPGKEKAEAEAKPAAKAAPAAKAESKPAE
jgi:hypothetical protein